MTAMAECASPGRWSNGLSRTNMVARLLPAPKKLNPLTQKTPSISLFWNRIFSTCLVTFDV